jgi:hypothetical protein
MPLACDATHVSEYVFHRQGHPVGDFRKAWATACIAAGLYRVTEIKPDGTRGEVQDAGLP